MSRSEKDSPSNRDETQRGRALLLDAATALLTSGISAPLLSDLYARLADLIGLEVFVQFDRRWPHLVVQRGLGVEDAHAIERAAATCLSSDEVTEVDAEMAPPPLDAALRGAGLERYVCHPLLDDGQRVGTLVFATRIDREVQACGPQLVHRLGSLVSAASSRDRSARALEATARTCRQIIESLDEGVCTIALLDEAERRPDFRFIEVNPAFEHQTGLTAPVGRTARELIPDLDEWSFEICQEVARTGAPRRFQVFMASMDRWFDLYAVRIGSPGDRRVGLTVRDVSESKRRERNLAFLAEINADLAELSSVGEILQEVGQKVGEHLGVSRVAFGEVDEPVETVRVFHEWRSRAELTSAVAVYRTSEFVEDELVQLMTSGHPVCITDVAADPRTAKMAARYARLNVRAIMHAPHRSGGRLKLILMVAKERPYTWRADEIELMDELSTRLWLRLERAWAEETLQAVADTAPVVLWMTDQTGAGTFVNRRWRELTGRSEKEALGDGWVEVIHPEDRRRVLRAFAEASARRRPFAIDFRVIGADGSHRWAVEEGTPRYDHDGRWVGYVGSLTDVHDRKMAEDRLRELDRRKDQFLAILSHELRNPLAPIENGLHILEMVDPDSDVAKRARRIIKRQVQQLIRLVDDLLDVTRVSRGKVQLHRELLDLVSLVRDTIDDHRIMFEEKGLPLRDALPTRPVFVVADANRLKQAVGNLLQNAAKFTGRGETTLVEVCEREERAVVRVVDTGVGMEPAVVASIFEPFVQSDDSLARESGGLGLGLALVRGIAELHGGKITAHSEGLGKGSVFELQLPLAPVEVRPSHPPPGVPSPRPLSILIIEDSDDVAETLQLLLEMEGHAVRVARDGAQGLEAARATRPDVVLCDLGLPGLDGYAVARALASDPELASIRRVAISGYALPEDIERSKAAGFHHHLAKPASVEKLRAALQTIAPRRAA